MRRLIVVVGPQGAGNKLFSKLFAMNPATQGWQQLLESDTELDHDLEPFHAAWTDPLLLSEYPWHESEIHVANISFPFVDVDNNIITPNLIEFINHAEKYANVTVVVIARDQNIITIQNHSYGRPNSAYVLMEQLQHMENNFIFVSQESVYLYKHLYWNSIERQLGLPLTDPELINVHLTNDRNKKYITNVTEQSMYATFKGDDWPNFTDDWTTASDRIQKEILEMYHRYYNKTSLDKKLL